MAAAIGAMLSITLGASLAKSLFPHIGPAGTTVLRLGIAALMLAVAFRVWRIRPDRRQWRAVLEGPERDIDARIARERAQDRDLWVIEIESRDARTLLDQPGLA